MNGARTDRSPAIAILVVLVIFGLSFARKGLGWVLEYQWWKELNQVETLFNTVLYSVVPGLVTALILFIVLWIAHARGLKEAGTRLRDNPSYARLSTLGLLVFSYFVATLIVDDWTPVLYVGGSKVTAQAGNWIDPVFGKRLTFYFFELPFYELVLRVLLVITFLTGLAYIGTMIFWSVKMQRPRLTGDGNIEWPTVEFDAHRIFGHSKFLLSVGVLFLLALAAERYLDRYDFLTRDHTFMIGVDYVDDRVRLPLRWLTIIGVLCGTLLLWTRRWILLGAVIVVPMLIESFVPSIVHAVYVRPNEISLEKPYINRHIEATRTAYGLDYRVKETEFKARLDTRIDFAKNKPLFDNVRLWDWRAFHDTVTQIQALRPYYVFHDTDVDRYTIDGQLRQVLLTPREIDVRQLSADARSRWMNPHFVYTHGYGLVLAEANRITPDGLPMLFIQNAPAEVFSNSLKLTRPEIYYGESVHEPVFVRTAQPEFNYPSGAENVHTKYDGKGGFPISSLPMRFAAAAAYTDWNILLTGFLTPESRMMIRRNVRQRVQAMGPFLSWDTDPYLVLTSSGRLVWMLDGYTSSNAHPYAQSVSLPGRSRANYVRNSVKATVDAYDGDVHIYIFDSNDPIIEAYAHLFPKLLLKASEMPAELRQHARYPEVLFRLQAEIYRTFHMRDAEAFYNKEDAWDLARYLNSTDGKPESVTPTYVVATLPGEQTPEFLLLIPFTPRNKDNLIGFMAARCDGEKLGELLFLQLSKQELIFGPLQVEARINQDQNISKDLSLWNQQGSRVLRGQMLVLPVDDTFVYIEPIYIQASEARMPQLKKVVMAMGNSMVYADTYEQALAQLTGVRPAAARTVEQPSAPGATPSPPPSPPAPTSDTERRLDDIRRHIQRYKELTSQGKFVEAAKELEALEGAVKR
jgi:uncharacterized membrane protein (UPF0182 family)